jgi:O-antigen/teichoic acid export membrane protein
MIDRLGLRAASTQTRHHGSIFVSAAAGTTPRVMPGRQATLSRFSGYFVLVGGTAVSRLLAFVTAVILARELGPSTFGEMSVFLTVLTFWVSGDFIDSTYVRFASAIRHGEEQRRYLGAALLLKLAWNLLLLMSALPLAWALSHLVLHKPVLLPAILLGLICGLGLNCLSLRAAMFQAQERFLRFTVTISAFYLLSFTLVAVLSLSASKPQVSWYYGAYVVSATLLGAFACGALLRAVRHLRFERDTVIALARFSSWLFGANLGSLIAERLNLFLLAGFASLATVGEYGAALRVVAIVSLLTGTLAPALLPRVARARESPLLLRAYLTHSAVLCGLIASLVGVLWVATPLLIGTLLGPAYAGAVPLVRLLLVATLSIAIYTPLSQLYFGESQPRRILYLAVLRLVLTVGAGAALISRFGAEGAAMTSALVEVVALAYVGLSLRNELFAALWHPRA